MKKISKILLFLAFAVFLMAGTASALTIGEVVGGAVNITGYDGENVWSSGWYGPQEDQEVEYYMVANQSWDLEAFFWDSAISTLYVVGGFNFATETSGFAAGDVFLFGANDEYVLDFARTGDVYTDLDEGAATFNIYQSAKDGLGTVDVYYSQNDFPSNPYAYDGISDRDGIVDYGSGSYTYYSGITDGLGIIGGNHYILALDLSGISFDPNIYQVHMTLECGNDTIKSSSVPEPATMLLFGTGLIGMATFGRKKFRRA